MVDNKLKFTRNKFRTEFEIDCRRTFVSCILCRWSRELLPIVVPILIVSPPFIFLQSAHNNRESHRHPMELKCGQKEEVAQDEEKRREKLVIGLNRLNLQISVPAHHKQNAIQFN